MAAVNWLAGQQSSLEDRYYQEFQDSADDTGYDDGGGDGSRKRWPWLIGLIILVVAAIAVAIVLFALPRKMEREKRSSTSDKFSDGASV